MGQTRFSKTHELQQQQASDNKTAIMFENTKGPGAKLVAPTQPPQTWGESVQEAGEVPRIEGYMGKHRFFMHSKLILYRAYKAVIGQAS